MTVHPAADLAEGLPDDELTTPTPCPPIEMDVGRISPSAPLYTVIEHP